MEINLFSPIKIKGLMLPNRVVLPPMVRFSLVEEDSFVTDALIDWYEAIAKSGVGMIVVEACCVSETGKLRPNQLGIWDRKFLPQLKKLADVCKRNGSVTFIQLHHVGRRDDLKAFDTETMLQIKADFVRGIEFAKECGFDGVELHGAHGYLLSQLNSSIYNNRKDCYGGDFEDRMRFQKEIIEESRALFDNDFILSYRLGANEPTLTDGIRIAKFLEEQGVSLLSISMGLGDPEIKNEVKIKDFPSEFPFDWCVYLGYELRKHVDIPIIGVRNIKKEFQASWLIENDYLDFVAIGRAMISRDNWMTIAKKEFKRRNASLVGSSAKIL